MERNKTLDHIFSLLGSMALSEAIDELETFGAAHPELSLDARLREIRSDYRLMFDYWSKGFKDEQLELVYRNFIYRMYRLTADVSMRYAIAHSLYLTWHCSSSSLPTCVPKRNRGCTGPTGR